MMKRNVLRAAAALAVLSVPMLAAACGPAVGDPCEQGDECGSGMYCFDAGDDTPTCQELPAECDESDPCGCDALLEQCDLGFSCVSFGETTALACL
ncbi:MAG: hypothetical protein HOW73_15775 [Polyangiaceae bacterium]|nr:hypothetical protein [Polyangiaceae bacterium]